MTEKDKVAIRHNLAMAQHELEEWREKVFKFNGNVYFESICIWIKQAQDIVNKDVK
tara:strand:+ start:575 stop:742 length:168 start_codon:yes stop_codon:yes gene_type:complete